MRPVTRHRQNRRARSDTPQTGTTGDLAISWDAVASASISFAAALDDQTDDAKVHPQETEIYTTDVGDVVSTEYAIRSGSGSQTMTIVDDDGDEDWVIVGAGFKEIAGKLPCPGNPPCKLHAGYRYSRYIGKVKTMLLYIFLQNRLTAIFNTKSSIF